VATTPSAQYSLTLRVEIDHRPGMLGKVASAIGGAGGTIGAVDLVQVEGPHTIRDITVETADAVDWPHLTDAVNAVPGVRVLDMTDRTFMLHIGGKIEVRNKSPLKTRDDLSMAYTPGVARVCTAIQADPDKAFRYTIKRNTVAVVSDGSAVCIPPGLTISTGACTRSSGRWQRPRTPSAGVAGRPTCSRAPTCSSA
jgi:malate dehydrogenase (oxaloacetate-decarboxylating)